MKHIIGFFKHWWNTIDGEEIAALLASLCFIVLGPLMFAFGPMFGLIYLAAGLVSIAFTILVITLFVYSFKVVSSAIDSYKDKVRRDEDRVIDRLKGI